MPPQVAKCAKCLRLREVSDMSKESNYRSAAYGYLVCQDCFDGPPKDNWDDIPPDTLEPPDGAMHV